MNLNICHFIPYHNDYHSIQTLNLVLETTPQAYSTLKSQAVYRIHYVCSGSGNLHIAGKTISLSKGDIFFTFPASPFCVESSENFTYMYISFLGSRANMIMDKLKINKRNCHFSNCQEVYHLWLTGLNSTPETTDLIAESILLYSFHFLGNKKTQPEKEKNLNQNVALIVKKYIDDNFSVPKLSLEMISHELAYSPKYISSLFKKNFDVGIVEYLNTIRIQNAYTLMQQGFTSISDVSTQCGYSDPQYFSKVFKQKHGISPKAYIDSLK